MVKVWQEITTTTKGYYYAERGFVDRCGNTIRYLSDLACLCVRLEIRGCGSRLKLDTLSGNSGSDRGKRLIVGRSLEESV